MMDRVLMNLVYETGVTDWVLMNPETECEAGAMDRVLMNLEAHETGVTDWVLEEVGRVEERHLEGSPPGKVVGNRA